MSGRSCAQKKIPTSVKVAFMSYSRSSFDILNAHTAIHPPEKIERNRSKQNTWFPNNDLRRQEWNAFLRSVWVFATSSAAMCWTINHDHAAESWTQAINPERMERGLEPLRRCGNAGDASADGNTRTVTTGTATHVLITRIKYGFKKNQKHVYPHNWITTRPAVRQTFTCSGFLPVRQKCIPLCRAWMKAFPPSPLY